MLYSLFQSLEMLTRNLLAVKIENFLDQAKVSKKAKVWKIPENLRFQISYTCFWGHSLVVKRSKFSRVIAPTEKWAANGGWKVHTAEQFSELHKLKKFLKLY